MLHMIRKLKADKLGEVYSPYFRDAVFASVEGGVRRPSIEMYVAKSDGRDLLLLYGNTQPLPRYGQYEVLGKILDVATSRGCDSVVSLAGLSRDRIDGFPQVFCTASDFETLENALKQGMHPISGEVYGMAGLIIGLARLRHMHGLCLFAETTGTYPDPRAAKASLQSFSKIYGITLDLSDLDNAADSLDHRLRYLEV